jgi:hypothetical protein
VVGISVPKTSLKAVVTGVGIVLVDGRLIFGKNTFEHGLIGELNIKLSQLR